MNEVCAHCGPECHCGHPRRAAGEPVGRSIVWQDRRTLGICEELIRRDGDGILDHTGAAIVPNAAGTKIRWVLENDSEVREGVERGDIVCGTIDSWIAWRLSGGRIHATDTSNASVTLLLDARTRQYSPRMLAELGIPESVLPKVVDTIGVVGVTDPDVLGAAIPIGALAGDQTAAAFGQACLRPGMVKSTYGTGSFLVMNTGAEYVSPKEGVMAPVLWSAGGAATYGLEGYADVAGAAIEWLRDGLHLIGHASEVDALAAEAPDNGGVVFVPAFAGLGSPHFDSYARGTILGLTRGSGPAQIARAALEAIAHQVADALDVIGETSGIAPTVLRVDGGASRSDLLMQIQADMLGIPVERPAVTETTGWGAALLAGVAVGVISGTNAVADLWHLERRFEPLIGDSHRRDNRELWQRAIEHSSGWLRR